MKTEERTELVSERQPDLVVYPLTQDIQINRSQLEKHLTVFKEAVKKELGFPEVLAILGLWSPLLTSDFKPLFGLTAGEVRVGYIVFSILLSLMIFSGRLKISICRLLEYFPVLKSKYDEYITDPEKKVNEIFRKSNE